MEIIEKINQGIPFLAADGLDATGSVAHGFSTRVGGVSEGMWAGLNLSANRGDDPDHVRENCRRFFAAIGAEGGKLAKTNQVHGNGVRIITTADAQTDICEKVDYEADALITAVPGFFFCKSADYFTAMGLMIGFMGGTLLDDRCVHFENTRKPLLYRVMRHRNYWARRNCIILARWYRTRRGLRIKSWKTSEIFYLTALQVAWTA